MHQLQVIEEIHDYVCGKSTQPLILSGESGCGKTAILAKAYSQVYHCYVITSFSYFPFTPSLNIRLARPVCQINNGTIYWCMLRNFKPENSLHEVIAVNITAPVHLNG